jgi:YVTN family beta-propeller protein
MTYPFRTIIGMLAGVVLLASATAFAQSADKSPLQLEAKIALGNVRGRIDHMAVDIKRQRLFVAELGNDTVGVVDLANRSVIRTIPGLSEPQGVGYEPWTDTLFVANARDGSVHLFDGNDYKSTGRIELGSDADNIRVDAAAKRVVIGYGGGALAIIDPATRSKLSDIPLKAHPESFQLDPGQRPRVCQRARRSRRGGRGSHNRKASRRVANGSKRQFSDDHRLPEPAHTRSKVPPDRRRPRSHRIHCS